MDNDNWWAENNRYVSGPRSRRSAWIYSTKIERHISREKSGYTALVRPFDILQRIAVMMLGSRNFGSNWVDCHVNSYSPPI